MTSDEKLQSCSSYLCNSSDRNISEKQTTSEKSHAHSPSQWKISARELRVHHPLDESVLCDFFRGLTTVLLSLTVGLSTTLIIICLCIMARLVRCLCAFCGGKSVRRRGIVQNSGDNIDREDSNSAQYSDTSARQRWSLSDRLVQPHDHQWLLPSPGNPREHQPEESLQDYTMHHAVLLLRGRVSVDKIRIKLLERIQRQQVSAPETVHRLLQTLVRTKLAGAAWSSTAPKPHTLLSTQVTAGKPLSSFSQLAHRLSTELHLLHSHPAALHGGPLWLVKVVPVTNTDCTVLIIHVHRVLADGMALLRLLCLILVDQPLSLPLAAKVTFGSITYTLNILRAFFYAPISFVGRLLGYCVQGTRSPADDHQQTSDHQPHLSHTDISLARLSWRKIMIIKQTTKYTVNEILLAIIAGALRLEMQRAGMYAPPALSAACTVDMRPPDETAYTLRLDTRCSDAVFSLPCNVEGAVPRLWAARRMMNKLKASPESAVQRLITTAIYRLLPKRLAASLARCTVAPPTAVIIGNMAASDSQLKFAGHRISGLYTCMAPPQHALAAVCLVSYNNGAYVTVTCRRQVAGRSVARRIQKRLAEELNKLYKLYKHRVALGRMASVSTDTIVLSSSRPTKNTNVDKLKLRLSEVQREISSLLHQVEEKRQFHENNPLNYCLGESDDCNVLDMKIRELKSEMNQLLHDIGLHNSSSSRPNMQKDVVRLSPDASSLRRLSMTARRLSSASTTSTTSRNLPEINNRCDNARLHPDTRVAPSVLAQTPSNVLPDSAQQSLSSIALRYQAPPAKPHSRIPKRDDHRQINAIDV